MFKKYSLLLIIALIVAIAAVPAYGSSGSVEGGGQIVEPMGSKRSQWHVISFGGWVEGDSDPTGEWEVNFHNVGEDDLDRTKFHGTDVRAVNYYPGNTGSCDAAMNLTVFGEWNHEPGYKVILRAGDGGSTGFRDTFRVEMWDDVGTKVYDTNWSGEFTAESNCVGSARTEVDAGNVTIQLP